MACTCKLLHNVLTVGSRRFAIVLTCDTHELPPNAQKITWHNGAEGRLSRWVYNIVTTSGPDSIHGGMIDFILDVIFLNTAKMADEHRLRGILAHEVGHLIAWATGMDQRDEAIANVISQLLDSPLFCIDESFLQRAPACTLEPDVAAAVAAHTKQLVDIPL